MPSIRKFGFYVDPSFCISSRELARLTYNQHGVALTKIAFVLPQFREQVLCKRVPPEGLMLNALQAYVAFSRLVRESSHYYIDELPAPVKNVFLAITDYKK